MATKQPTINQHEILHRIYQDDCCLCKAEDRIKRLENNTLTALQKRCHDLAIEKGFWIPTGVEGEVRYRNESELLMLVVSELGEACEALRKNERQAKAWLNGEEQDLGWRKDTFEDELADAVIRILDMAEALKINLAWQIEKKLEYNQTRPIRHGKEF